MKHRVRRDGCFVKMLLVLMVLDLNVALANDTWDKVFSGSNTGIANSVQETSDGGYIIAGCTSPDGGVFSDFWLIKTDGKGEKIWDKAFSEDGWDIARSIQETSDGGYIVTGVKGSPSGESSDFWLIKTDGKGEKIWDKTFGGSSWDEARSVQETSDGGYIVAGNTKSYGPGEDDFWLIKTDGEGEKVWEKIFGGDSTEEVRSVQETSDGGYIVAGCTNSYGEGDYDYWLIKTDGEGEKIWDKTFGGSKWDRARSIQETSDGGYIIAGITHSHDEENLGSAFWLIKTDVKGEKIWDKTFGGSGGGGAYSVQETSDGGYILAGNTNSGVNRSIDILLIKTDGKGEKIWDKTFGGSEMDRARSVQQTSDGGYVVAGMTCSYGEGEENVWLIKTDEEGTEISSDRIVFGKTRKESLSCHAYPDPAHSGCYIQLSPAIKSKMNGNQKVSLRIYTTQGRMIQEINAERIVDKNNTSFYWDGIDSKGNKLTQGCYLLSLLVSDKVMASSKIFLTR